MVTSYAEMWIEIRTTPWRPKCRNITSYTEVMFKIVQKTSGLKMEYHPYKNPNTNNNQSSPKILTPTRRPTP